MQNLLCLISIFFNSFAVGIWLYNLYTKTYRHESLAWTFFVIGMITLAVGYSS